MFEIISEWLIALINILPFLVGLYFIFDLVGSLLFGKR